MVNEILNGAEENIRSWLNDFDFYAMPVHNPDGYAFTHTNVSEYSRNHHV